MDSSPCNDPPRRVAPTPELVLDDHAENTNQDRATIAVMFDPDFGRVADGTLRVVNGWGIRNAGTAREHLHQGLDIPMPVGTPIYAAASGVVTQLATTDSSDAGIYAGIRHLGGLTSRYLHLSSVSVERGQHVGKGDPIGLSGNTGLSQGPHLHFDLFASTEAQRAVEEAVGEPKGGFGRGRLGIAVPAEPWLPIDQYASHVIAAAEKHGIPLFDQRLQQRPRDQDPGPRELSRPTRPLVAVAAGFGIAALALIAWRASSD